MSLPTSLLPSASAAGPRSVVPAGVAGTSALDAVHDHVLRLLGDPSTTMAVIADVALRAADRAADHADALTHTGLLRAAHARLRSEERTAPDRALVEALADGSATHAVLVTAMAVPGMPGAALLDLTTRHGIDLRTAAAIVGVDRASAARLRTEALRQVRSHLTDAGVGLGADIATELATLPVMAAPSPCHDLLDRGSAVPAAPRVPTALAWLGTTAAIIATVAGVTFALPRLTAAATPDAPIASAVMVEDGPAVRQLSVPGDDDPGSELEPLVVRDRGSDDATQPLAPAGNDEAEDAAPAPDDAPSASPGPDDGDGEQPDDASSPEPDGDEGLPLGDLLPGGDD